VNVRFLNAPQRKGTAREQLVTAFREWDDTGRIASPTAALLTGLFYTRYKERYRLLPVSDVQMDTLNMGTLLTRYTKDDPHLSSWIIEFFFSLRHFNNIQSGSFVNANILSKWGAFEGAEKASLYEEVITRVRAA